MKQQPRNSPPTVLQAVWNDTRTCITHDQCRDKNKYYKVNMEISVYNKTGFCPQCLPHCCLFFLFRFSQVFKNTIKINAHDLKIS